MGRWVVLLALLAGLLALVACAAEEKATPAPTTPGAEARAAWEQEWERVLAAAKREGKVTVLGPTGAENRRALTEPFEKKYGITVDFFAGSGSELAPRIRTERQAGQYLWDVYVGGISTMVNTLKPMGALGYKEITAYLSGEVSLEEAARLIKRNTRHYAKRQLTWFKKDPEIKWFSPGDKEGIIGAVKRHLSPGQHPGRHEDN